jgi:glycosyltransferase involved in cell wall biosynthesis
MTSRFVNETNSMPSLLLASTVPAFIKAFLLPFSKHFRTKGWRVDAVAKDITKDPECVAHFDAVWDVDWSRNPLDPANFRAAPRVLRNAVCRERYDIVHVHTPVASLVARYALRHYSAALKICTAHGFHFHDQGRAAKNALYLGLERWAGRWTDYLIVINRDDEAAARKHRIVPPERLLYMPGIGVDTVQKYNPALIDEMDISTSRRSIQAGPNDALALMVAEFIPRKRHADALLAWKRLTTTNAHLVLAGSGQTQTAMIELCRQLGLERRVHFVGLRSDVPALIKASHMLLLCSDQEGLPRSIMEALSLGTPVIGSDIRGTRELLQDGAGYLYPVGNVQALAKTVQHVLENPAEACVKAKVGQKRMGAYDLKHIITLHEDLYANGLRSKTRLARLAC